MAMIGKSFGVVITALVLTAPAFADDAAPDTKTGEVALCSKRTVGWACEAAPEDRAVLENEIGRLRTENAALKKDILSRGLPLPAGTMPEPPVVRNGDHTLQLPGNADVDHVVALMGRMWHRLVDAIARAQQHMLNKS
jgi:hypothetical protein